MFMAQWLIRQDMDFYWQGIQKLILKYDKFFCFGRKYMEKNDSGM
jgi:hypothetical protein